MPMPKSKISRSRRGKRRAHDSVEPATHLSICPTNGELHLSHKAYKASDGAYYYKGKQLTPIKSSSS